MGETYKEEDIKTVPNSFFFFVTVYWYAFISSITRGLCHMTMFVGLSAGSEC